jgi:hypothetical protein
MKVARDQGAELIVVGHTGSGYVTRALLGSTARTWWATRCATCWWVGSVGSADGRVPVRDWKEPSLGPCGRQRASGERTSRG